MFNYFRVFLRKILHICHTNALNVFSTWKNSRTDLALYNAYLIMQLFYVKKTLKAMVCQMGGNDSKTQYEIIKHYQKDHIIFFHSKS